jgi:hypothetical protein
MKRLHVQIQPARSAELNIAEAVAQLGSLASGAQVTELQNDGSTYNVDFRTPDLPVLWECVRDVVHAVPGLARAAIIVCEGEHGWDDYLLLHHFNPKETVDTLA